MANVTEATSSIYSARVPAMVLIVAILLGGAGLFFGLSNPLGLPSLLLWGVALVILMLGVPQELALGVALAVALAISFTLGPINAPKTALYIASIASSLVLLGGLLRQGKTRVSPKFKLALGLGLGYFFLVLLSTTLVGIGIPPTDLLILLIVPGVLALVTARRMTALDFRVFARGFMALAVAQVIVASMDIAGIPVPFFGYAMVIGERLSNSLLLDIIPREQGLAGHPIVMALILILAIVLLWRNSIQAKALTRSVLFGILIWGLIISGTRSAIVALIAGLLFLAIVNARTSGARIRNFAIVLVLTAVALTNSVVFSYVEAVVTGLGESGSYSHRAGAFEAVPGLFDGLPTLRLLFGSGAGSEPVLFAQGYLQQDGFNIVDNQFVTTLATSGIIGLALIVVLIVRALIFGTATVRGLLVVMVVMMNSFDMLRWTGPALIFFAILAWPDSLNFRARTATDGRHPVLAAPSDFQSRTFTSGAST